MTIEMKPEIQIDTNIYTVKQLKYLTDSTFVLQMPNSGPDLNQGNIYHFLLQAIIKAGNILFIMPKMLLILKCW